MAKAAHVEAFSVESKLFYYTDIDEIQGLLLFRKSIIFAHTEGLIFCCLIGHTSRYITGVVVAMSLISLEKKRKTYVRLEIRNLSSRVDYPDKIRIPAGF